VTLSPASSPSGICPAKFPRLYAVEMTRPRPLRLAVATLLLSLPLLVSLHPASAMTPEERRAYLEKLQQILPDAPAFRAWLEKTGELPPDFDSLPRMNALPDPLHFLDGRPVRTLL
jgi:hypothetical protein